jgi:hypothetical protein
MSKRNSSFQFDELTSAGPHVAWQLTFRAVLICALGCSTRSSGAPAGDASADSAHHADGAVSFGDAQIAGGGDAETSAATWVADSSAWALGISGAVIYDLAVDATGAIVLVGNSHGNVTIASGVELAAPESGVVLFKLDSTGKYLWGHAFAGDDALRCFSVAVGPDNAIVVGCVALATTSVLDSTVPAPDERDVVILKWSTDGNLEWLKLLGGKNWQQEAHVAVDSQGAIYVAGNTNGEFDFGGGPRPAMGHFDAFLAKLAPDGTHIYSKVFGDAQEQYATSLAIAPNADVLLAGTFTGQMDFGAGPLTAWGFGAVNFYLARFNANGDVLRNQRIVSTSGVPQVYIAPLPNDGVALCGAYQDTIQLGSTTFQVAGNNSNVDDGFLASVASQGNYTSARVFGGDWLDDCSDIATSEAGEVFATGDFGDVINLGGNDLGVAGQYGAFYARYNSNGQHQSSTAWLSSGYTVATAIGVLPSGRVALAGYMLEHTALNLGFTQLPATDGFVMVIPP